MTPSSKWPVVAQAIVSREKKKGFQQEAGDEAGREKGRHLSPRSPPCFLLSPVTLCCYKYSLSTVVLLLKLSYQVTGPNRNKGIYLSSIPVNKGTNLIPFHCMISPVTCRKGLYSTADTMSEDKWNKIISTISSLLLLQ